MLLVTPFFFSLLQSNRQPAKLNLLTCQVKPNAEDKKSFDLISRESFFSPSRSRVRSLGVEAAVFQQGCWGSCSRSSGGRPQTPSSARSPPAQEESTAVSGPTCGAFT